MTKIRVLIFVSTVVIVIIGTTFAALYANGYRFDKQKGLSPNGLLVVNSDPNGAQIFIDNQLKTATNATLSLAPGTYEVTLKKDGFISWHKVMGIQKEEVTQINAVLFPTAPSLSAITFDGAINPTISPDRTKVVYGVAASKENQVNTQSDERSGIWVLETVNLPLGFNREPRRIADGDITAATWQWSTDSHEILLTVKNQSYLLSASTFTSQLQRQNITSQIVTTTKDWAIQKQERLTSQLSKLPQQLTNILTNSAQDINFSPDEDKILYTASQSATIPEGLVSPLPGSSTQKQTRSVKQDSKYVYDIKEDRNFEVAQKEQLVYWMPTSAHLLLPQKDKIIIEDYDGTNLQTIYGGGYIFPFAFPTGSTGRILILTNFGADQTLINLYSMSLK